MPVVRSMAQGTGAGQNQREWAEGREGCITLFMIPSFSPLSLEDPRKAVAPPYGVNNLYTENYRSWLKEIKEGASAWNNTPCS